MNKVYLVDGKPYEVAPHREEEFLSTMKSQGKSPVSQDQGNQKDPATSATAGSETAAQTQEVNPPQVNQTTNTESPSEGTSSESVDSTLDKFRAFKPKEERLLEIQSEAQGQIDLLNQISQAELPPKNVVKHNAFTSKYSTAGAFSGSNAEYQQARNKQVEANRELNSLKEEATRNILRSHYSTTGEKLEPGTEKYEDFIKNIPQESINTEMLKARSKNIEQQEFEDNFEEAMEELSSVENPFSILAAGSKKSSYQKDLEQETSESAKKLNNEIQSNVKRSKQFISNLESVESKFNDLKNLQTKLGDINAQANKINSAEYKTQEEVDDANKQLASLRLQFDKLNTDYDSGGGLTYEELIDFRDKNLKGFDNAQKEGSGLVEKEEELTGYLDAVGRNYGWAANLSGQLASGAMTLGSGVLEVGQKALEIPKELDMPEWIAPLMGPVASGMMKATPLIREGIDAIDKVNEDLLNGLEKPGEFKDISNGEELGEWFGHLVTSQAANTAVTFTTGGASLFILGASSAGQKFKDIDREERDTGKNYTFAQKYSTAILTGLAEGLSEKVTLGQANKVKALLKANPAAKRGFANTMKRNFFTRKGLYENLYDPIEEGGTEVLAQLASNATDRFILGDESKSLLEGATESFISGVFMSGLVYKSPLIGKNVAKAFQSTDATAELQSISEKIQQKSRILSEVELSPENRKAIESDIGMLVGQHSQLMDETVSNIDKMTPQEKQALIDVDVTIAALKANNKSIRGEFGLTPEQIESQVKDNNAQIANLTALKNQTIANANKSENLGRVERDTKELERKATKMFGKPISVVKIDSENISEQLKTYKKAEVEAVDKKIKKKKEDLKTADEESKTKIKEEIKQLQEDKASVKALTEETFNNSHGASAIHADMILVNPEFAAERGATNVVQHEMMHQLLKNTLADNPRAAIALGNAVDDILSDLDPDAVAQSEMSSRLTAYINKPESVRAEEKVTLLMDALKSGDIKINTSLGAKLKSPIRRILQASGMKNVELNTAEDVLNFITDMNAKSNMFGRNKAFTKASLEGIKIGRELTAGVTEDTDTTVEPKESIDVEASERVQDLYKPILDIQNKEIKTEADLKMMARMKDDISGVIAMEYRGMAENIFSRALANAQTEDIRNDLLDNKEDIIADILYDPGTDKAKARTVLGLVKDFNPAKHKYQNVAAYINQFLPQRAKEVMAKRGVQDTATKSMTDEGIAKQAESVTTEEGIKQSGPKRKGIVLADRLKVRDKIAPKAKQYVKDNDLTGTTYKKTPNIATETVGELMSIPSKKITSNANLSKPELANAQMFIAKNADMLQSMLPEGATEDGTATGVQKVLLDKFYNKKSKREKTKAGLTAQSKKPNITRTEFLEVFGIIDGKPQRDDRNTSSRVLALAKQLDRAMSNQAIREVLMQDDTQATTVQQMASGKSPVMFSEDAVSVSRELKKYANMESRHILKDAGITDPLLSKVAKIVSTKVSRTRGEVPVTLINFESLVQIGREVGRDKTLGEETSRIIKTMADLDPVYATLFRVGMSNGRGKSMFGVKDVFDELAGMRRYELPNFLKRFRFHSTQKLDPKRVVKKNGEVKFIVGKQELSGKEFFEFEQQKIDFLAKMFTDVQKHLKNNPDDAWFFARFVTNASSNGDAIFRTSASLVGVYYKDGKLHYDVEMREEHSMPQNNIGTMFLSAAINQTPIDNVLKVAKAAFVQLSLTQVDDNMLKAIKDKDGNILRESLVDSMPNEFWEEVVPAILDDKLPWLDLGMASMIRYAKGGINLNNYFLPSKNMTIPEYFKVGIDTKGMSKTKVRALVDVQNNLISEILTGKITREQASEYVDAISEVGLIANEADIKNLDNTRKAREVVRNSTDGNIQRIVPDRKAILVVGASGSGKSTIIKKLGLKDQGFEVMNPDIALEKGIKKAGLPKDMNEFTREQSEKFWNLQYDSSADLDKLKAKQRETGKSIVTHSTGAQKAGVERSVREFKQAGYDVQIIFVDSSLETALARNKARPERILTNTAVKNSYKSIQANKKRFKELGVNFVEINTDNLKQDQPLPRNFIGKIDKFSEVRFDNANSKGMSTFDFDETLIIGGENFVVATDPVTKQQVKITSEEWPIEGPEYAAAGYEFDFSDFANVRGGKEGPLLQKLKNQIAKYGNKNVFILTARQQASAGPIQQWLKTQGVDLPLRNITGLGKSEGEAKGQWMLQKFAEGYNDMYFVDDALPNVKAVKDVLDQLDIKSKVVQAKLKFSQDGAANFNNILERSSGVPIGKVFSDAQARLRGKKVDGGILKKFFVPPSAEDFKGLLYNFLGKGKQGDADMAFFKEHLLDPFAKGIRDMNFAKQRTSEEFKTLKKEMPTVIKNLNKNVSGTDFTVNDAIRVYLWSKSGIDIPGISENEIELLSDHVNNDPKTKAFADTLGIISRAKDGYVTPDENWVVGNIASDLFGQSSQTNRAEFLSEWKDNVDIIFSPENMNKIEAVYGTDFRDALENMLYRMETGSNRVTGKKDKVVNGFMDWINGSVGAVMFFNTRSAMLQTLSTVNFIDWGDNNIFQAAKAFANQPQYWKDFITLFNSDMLKQRRSGMSIDVNLSELSNTVAKSGAKDKYKAAVRYLLQIGFTPTQIADSFAIASGGATYYRNKINKYIKEGLSQKEAETKAFDQFQEIAEETQQSSRPDLISQQQAGTLGRLVLAWQNTPMQYTRLTKKAISDLVNGRGDWKSHVSRILYYGAMQNVIFGSLQTGLAFLLFGGDEDEEKTKTKTTRVANGALDTLLRGTGVYGAMASTLKNTIMKYLEERDKPYGKRELSKVAIEAVQLSPPIGSKLRKIMSAIYSYEYNKDVPEKMGLDIDNPILNVIGNLVEATTNVPLARVVRKAQNLEEAINSNHETWKRVALIAGWDKWSLDVKDKELEEAKAKVKQERAGKKKAESEDKKKENKRKRAEAEKNRKDGDDLDGDGKKEYRCKANTRGGKGPRCKNITERKNKRCYAHQ